MDEQDVIIRRVEKADMIAVIDMLQSVSKFEPSVDEYIQIWNNFDAQPHVHSLVVLLDDKIIGYGSVIIEMTIRGGKLGYVTDIVSHTDHRKKGIGNIIMESLYDLAKKVGCYKLVLQCNDHNVEFYKRCAYDVSGVSMRRFIS